MTDQLRYMAILVQGTHCCRRYFCLSIYVVVFTLLCPLLEVYPKWRVPEGYILLMSASFELLVYIVRNSNGCHEFKTNLLYKQQDEPMLQLSAMTNRRLSRKSSREWSDLWSAAKLCIKSVYLLWSSCNIASERALFHPEWNKRNVYVHYFFLLLRCLIRPNPKLS